MLRAALLSLAGAALLAFPVTTGNGGLSASGAKTSAPAARVTAASGGSGAASVVTGNVSSNWSGYVGTTGPYAGVSASWAVPALSQSGGAVAEWVGLGGAGQSPELVQCGVIEQYGASGAEATAFTENLPAAAKMGKSVPAGQVVTASVAPAGTNRWTMTVRTASQVLAQQTVTLTASQAQAVEQSADWIVESPSTDYGRIEPLAVLTAPVQFTNATFETTAGRVESLNSAGTLDALVLESANGLEAQPGTIAADGASFTITESQAQGYGYGYGGGGGYYGNGGGYGYGYGYGGGRGYGYGGGGWGYGRHAYRGSFGW